MSDRLKREASSNFVCAAAAAALSYAGPQRELAEVKGQEPNTRPDRRLSEAHAAAAAQELDSPPEADAAALPGQQRVLNAVKAVYDSHTPAALGASRVGEIFSNKLQLATVFRLSHISEAKPQA